MTERVVTASHEAQVRSPAGEVYRLLADLGSWPWIFAPFVHLERLGAEGAAGAGGDPERIGMWSVSGDTVERWVVRRRLDEAGLRIDLSPETPHPPVTAMRRSWTVAAESERVCSIRLEHECRVSGAEPGAAEAVADTVEELGRREVAAVCRAAETASLEPELLVTVDDAVVIAAPPAAVYQALHRADAWPSFMPHVARAEVRASAPGSHLLELETIEPHGGRLVTRAARVGLAPGTIAYKQLLLPPLGASHHVRWAITGRPGGSTVTSRQRVVLRRSGIAAVLGDRAGVPGARSFVRAELGGKVRLILQAVREHLEQPRENAGGPGGRQR